MVFISGNMVAPYEVGKSIRSYVNIPHSRGIRYMNTGILTLNLVPHMVPATHHQHPSSAQQASTQHGESEGGMINGAGGSEGVAKNFKKRKFSKVA